MPNISLMRILSKTFLHEESYGKALIKYYNYRTKLFWPKLFFSAFQVFYVLLFIHVHSGALFYFRLIFQKNLVVKLWRGKSWQGQCIIILDFLKHTRKFPLPPNCIFYNLNSGVHLFWPKNEESLPPIFIFKIHFPNSLILL